MRYTWTVRDADGDEAALTFTIEVEEDLMPSFGDAGGRRADVRAEHGDYGADAARGDGRRRDADLPPGARAAPGAEPRRGYAHADGHAVADAGIAALHLDGDGRGRRRGGADVLDNGGGGTRGGAAVQGAVKQALAATARRAMSGALDNIGARFGDIGASGLSLAGQWVPLAGRGGGGGGHVGGRRARCLRAGPFREAPASGAAGPGILGADPARLRGSVEPVDDGGRAVRR